MKIGLLTRNSEAWCSTQLLKAMERRGVQPIPFSFNDIVARVGCKPILSIRNFGEVIDDLKAILVRPIGRGSLDEVIFRLDALHRAERRGLIVVNPPSAIEKSVDKYYALTLLEEDGIPIPPTIVTESPQGALEGFDQLGGDVVIKPIFGSRGLGVTRVSDREVARRIFRSLNYNRNILYIQKFIPHGTRDVRAFVVGDTVVAAMYRESSGWRTNISFGAKPVSMKASSELEELVVRAARVLECEVAGVDVMQTPEQSYINEINSQPGFRGLQSVTKVDIADKIVEHIITLAK